jgi:hypothetical protein
LSKRVLTVISSYADLAKQRTLRREHVVPNPKIVKAACPASDRVEVEFKRCSCGARYTDNTWSQLPYLGIQEDEYRFELRSCARCGSSIGVHVPYQKVPTLSGTSKPHPAARVGAREGSGRREDSSRAR